MDMKKPQGVDFLGALSLGYDVLDLDLVVQSHRISKHPLKHLRRREHKLQFLRRSQANLHRLTLPWFVID